jgi:CRISPR-associated exonuclease Cas4
VRKIPVSWLGDYAFCEYQIYLEHVRGVDAGEKPERRQDKAARVGRDEAYQSIAELGLSVSQALEKAQGEGIALSARGVSVEGVDLVGCIDEIIFMADRILIVDDKPDDIAWPSSRMQAWGYCLAFEQHYAPRLPLMAGIRSSDTAFEIWAQPFDQEHREEVRKAVFRIRQILDREILAVGTRNRRKCRVCRFGASCDARSL